MRILGAQANSNENTNISAREGTQYVMGKGMLKYGDREREA